MAPGGSQSQVGILAGENHGTVEQVTVTGDVTGDEDVGALVGVNGSSGVVRSCTNRASVTGNTNSGGIAGRNEGMIQSCTNLGEVNTGGNDAATNSGGIAGRNTGTVADCTNHAAVATPTPDTTPAASPGFRTALCFAASTMVRSWGVRT